MEYGACINKHLFLTIFKSSLLDLLYFRTKTMQDSPLANRPWRPRGSAPRCPPRAQHNTARGSMHSMHSTRHPPCSPHHERAVHGDREGAHRGAHFRHELAAAGVGCQVPHPDVAVRVACEGGGWRRGLSMRGVKVSGCRRWLSGPVIISSYFFTHTTAARPGWGAGPGCSPRRSTIHSLFFTALP